MKTTLIESWAKRIDTSINSILCESKAEEGMMKVDQGEFEGQCDVIDDKSFSVYNTQGEREDFMDQTKSDLQSILGDEWDIDYDPQNHEFICIYVGNDNKDNDGTIKETKDTCSECGCVLDPQTGMCPNCSQKTNEGCCNEQEVATKSLSDEEVEEPIERDFQKIIQLAKNIKKGNGDKSDLQEFYRYLDGITKDLEILAGVDPSDDLGDKAVSDEELPFESKKK